MNQKEQPGRGLFRKYRIERVDGKPIDPNDEYFILKVKGEGDQIHIKACRKAVLVYADAVKNHLPELSNDLIDRYGKHSPQDQEIARLQDQIKRLKQELKDERTPNRDINYDLLNPENDWK